MVVYLHAADDVGAHFQAGDELVKGRKEHFLDFLQVAEVAARQVVHHQRNLLWQGLQLVAAGADELKHVGVLLVRHNAGAGRTFVGQLDKSEVLRVEQAGVEGHLGHRAGNAG